MSCLASGGRSKRLRCAAASPPHCRSRAILGRRAPRCGQARASIRDPSDHVPCARCSQYSDYPGSRDLALGENLHRVIAEFVSGNLHRSSQRRREVPVDVTSPTHQARNTPSAALPFAIWLIVSYFEEIPREREEAALLDR